MSRIMQMGATALLTSTLLCSFALAGSRDSIGVATSSLPFAIADTIVESNGTILEGETVTASNLPARIETLDGERYVVGIGSRVRVEKNEIALEGGSVRMETLTESKTPVTARGLRFVPLDIDTDFEVLSDSTEEASVIVYRGAVSVQGEDGIEMKVVSAGEATLVAVVDEEIVTDSERAPNEITRIQTRQVEELAKWEKASRRKGLHSKKLLAMLAGGAGSAALVGATAGSAGVVPGVGGAQQFAPALQTSAAVANGINAEELDMGECGNSSCIDTVPLVSNQFYYFHLGFGFGFGIPGFCIVCP